MTSLLLRSFPSAWTELLCPLGDKQTLFQQRKKNATELKLQYFCSGNLSVISTYKLGELFSSDNVAFITT
jgi:hypothetical protein